MAVSSILIFFHVVNFSVIVLTSFFIFVNNMHTRSIM